MWCGAAVKGFLFTSVSTSKGNVKGARREVLQVAR